MPMKSRPTAHCSAAAILGALLALGAAGAQAQGSAAVATATSIEGTVFVTRSDGRQTLLARGSALSVGDAINTTRNSTVRLRFSDGGETVIRPESALAVQAYSYNREQPQGDNLVLSLLRGGLRAITGSIGKRGNLDAYRLNVNTATIGIRGTDYSARLCNKDCRTDTAALSTSTSNSAAPVVARVLQLRGQLSAERAGQRVELPEGAPLYASDKVETISGGHAVLAFRDDTRITLNSGTRLALTQYNFEPEQPAQGNSIFQLLRGGLRVATGLIGKANPSKVRIQSSTATIGIRGTVFDITCGPAAGNEDTSAAELSDMACDQSMFATARSGAITLAAADGREISLSAGQSGLVPGVVGAARVLGSTPAYFNSISTPAPESVPVKLEQLFGGEVPAAAPEGVYLLVREGKVVVEQAGQNMALDAGESAFAGLALPPLRLSIPPAVLNRDPFLSNKAFNFNICR